MNKIIEIIKAVELKRPGYASSVGFNSEGALDPPPLPSHLSALYRYVRGTASQVPEQKFMDIIPGYRLMLPNEIVTHRSQLQDFYRTDELFNVRNRAPFLTNYSSDFYLVPDDDTGVYWLDHEAGICKASVNLDGFLETILQCYTLGAYAVDSDGYLDVDFELEMKIGKKLNPGLEF